MITRAQSLPLLLLAAAALRSATAQELVVVVESPTFNLDTRLSSGSGFSALVAATESAAFTLDTRLASGSGTAALVVTDTSPAFTLDTRLAVGSAFSALVVTAESAAFALDTRLAGRIDALIVEAVSPTFSLNTMWLGIRRTARIAGSPVELYWPTNAPGFYPQWAPPPLRESMQWSDVPDTVSESGGFYRALLSPEGTERYFRLKM